MCQRKNIYTTIYQLGNSLANNIKENKVVKYININQQVKKIKIQTEQFDNIQPPTTYLQDVVQFRPFKYLNKVLCIACFSVSPMPLYCISAGKQLNITLKATIT